MRRTTFDQLSFGLRANALRVRRVLRDLGAGPPLLSRAAEESVPDIDWPEIAGASVTPLRSSGPTERRLTAGKIQNLRRALHRLDGLRIPAGSVFSFWRHIGRPSRYRGYVAGRELREGCMVASIGGGLCQLSNALYAAALEAGCEIIERHRHSRVIPGSLAERDLDATVFWNYVDLRFRPATDMVIEARLTADDLIVRLRSAVPQHPAVAPGRASPAKAGLGDCLSCTETSCVYHINTPPAGAAIATSWLLDECWPEFDLWLQQHCRPQDQFFLPLDGLRWKRRNYAWHLPAGRQLHTYPLETLMQASRLRRLANQGPQRQRALLERDRRLAEAYDADLPYETDHLVVSLNLLPFLWRCGTLGGRRYTVLMTRAPLSELQHGLDQAAILHPASPTLRDFRAPAWLLAAEQAGLKAASSLVTPHAALATTLAALYPGRVKRISWQKPQMSTVRRKEHHNVTMPTRILFGGAALARKGAYEMREAARRLPIILRLPAGAQEAAGFWQGLEVEGIAAGCDPLADIACVVLPAFVEHRPRLLLQAIARGILVICTPACGLEPQAGVILIEAGNVPALTTAIAAILSQNDLAPAMSAE